MTDIRNKWHLRFLRTYMQDYISLLSFANSRMKLGLVGCFELQRGSSILWDEFDTVSSAT